MKNLPWLAIFLSFTLPSCRVGPTYESPCSPVPAEWKNAHTNSPQPHMHLDCWWEIFNDSLLSKLEKEAMSNSPTLDMALAKVMEARALAGVQAASLYPQATLDPFFENRGLLNKAYLPSNLVQIPGFPTNIPPFRIHEKHYMLPLNLNYELDLWGKLQDRFDAAVFNAQAEEQNYYTSLLTLTADVATSYFHLRTLDAQIQLLMDTIKTRQTNYELTKERFDKGLTNYLDVAQAEADLNTAKAAHEDSKRMRMLAENQIAVLTGNLAPTFHLEAMPLIAAPPEVPPGLPSELLLKRPDIAQAERQMASEHALINAAYASFFPSINLTAALGFSSPDIRQFLQWISRYWMYGANMSQMIFNGGRDEFNYEATLARFVQASGNYQQLILAAFREVEDALNNIELHAKQANYLKIATEAAKKATSLSKNRYVNGVAIYLEVVENERQALQTEINWIGSLSQSYTATVQLIKALGGSIEVPAKNLKTLNSSLEVCSNDSEKDTCR